MCRDPFITVNSSSAAVYRSVSEDPPTLLVDEADTIFGPKADGNEDLRGLLNAGHQRNRPAKRYDAATNHVQSIPIFAMAALAGIGAMPDTIEDRAVVIRMRRRAPNESVAPYRHRRDRATVASARRPAHRVAARRPGGTGARRAGHAGGRTASPTPGSPSWPWPTTPGRIGPTVAEPPLSCSPPRPPRLEKSRRGSGCSWTAGRRSVTHDAIPTTVLLERLRSDREAPWADYGPTGLTAMKLGVLPRDYDIRSATIRFPGLGQAKGYQRADFTDAWTQYCPQPHAGRSRPAGTAVPPVPASFSQFNTVRLIRVVRLKAYHRAHPYQPDQAKRGWYGWYGFALRCASSEARNDHPHHPAHHLTRGLTACVPT